MRRILFAIAIVLGFSTAVQAACDLPEGYKPIMRRYAKGVIFRAEGCQGQVSYIMGTMHSDSRAIKPIFNDALAVLQQVHKVGFEFVEDEHTAETAMRYMFYPANNKEGLHAVLPQDTYSTLAEIIVKRAGLPYETVARLRPWAAAIMLQLPASETDGIVLDQQLQQQAKKLNKPLFGLETPEEQYNIFARIPDAKQISMLQDSIKQVEEMDRVNARFLAAYTSRNLRVLHTMADSSFRTMSDVELRRYMEQELLHKRNANMANRAEPYLQEGNMLLAIGALHLLGNDGVLPLLEKQGYQIEVVR